MNLERLIECANKILLSPGIFYMLCSWIHTVYILQTYFTYLDTCVYTLIYTYTIKYAYIMHLCICGLKPVSKINLFNLNRKCQHNAGSLCSPEPIQRGKLHKVVLWPPRVHSGAGVLHTHLVHTETYTNYNFAAHFLSLSGNALLFVCSLTGRHHLFCSQFLGKCERLCTG